MITRSSLIAWQSCARIWRKLTLNDLALVLTLALLGVFVLG